ncbi:acetaldehyde dehydrogenase (acetylating) [Amycolatopsis alba]|uniref:acetaldehyde dehydrogenase (acetylating) n=1 Tax=Amycolatopsis alba TaxID=76020 RepID=UPI001ADFF445|nr:acetaldehyde dehydrogenase (acetylating) [Amycolatopsis alba]
MTTRNRERARPTPVRIGIVGTGALGTDLLCKVLGSRFLRCVLFAGRRPDSPGLLEATRRGVPTSIEGIDAVLDHIDEIDMVLDVSTADGAARHWRALEPTGKSFIDLTPAKLGKFCIPVLNLAECLELQYASMVTCGGQAAVPMARAICDATDGLDYLEIVSTTSSASVGPATRANIDEYVVATENATRQFCHTNETKTILVLNPAKPGVVMRNAVAATTSKKIDLDLLRKRVSEMETKIRSYVPGYQVVVPPVSSGNTVQLTLRVEGLGDWLPDYAGNLDVISCAAVALAEERARELTW